MINKTESLTGENAQIVKSLKTTAIIPGFLNVARVLLLQIFDSTWMTECTREIFHAGLNTST